MARGRGTPRDYTPAWPAIAFHIKSRAAWHCERCGHAHEPASGHTLTVAHLDHAYGNQRFNLAALCQRCHLMYECRFHFAQGYMFAHSAWMVPHVLAWRFFLAASGRRGRLYRYHGRECIPALRHRLCIPVLAPTGRRVQSKGKPVNVLVYFPRVGQVTVPARTLRIAGSPV